MQDNRADATPVKMKATYSTNINNSTNAIIE
jgi:hypothetical protein